MLLRQRILVGRRTTMEKITKIYELEVNEEKEMVLLVTEVRDKGYTQKGEPYAAVDLFDGEKSITVNFFRKNVANLESEGVKKDAILKIKLTKQANGYYNQSGYRLNDDSSIIIADFKHMAPIDPDAVFEWLLNQIKSVDPNAVTIGPYNSIAQLTLNLLIDNKEAFKRSSAAVSMHHNFLGGLLYHTQRMVMLAESFCEVYPALDKELLVCATALHDIGKISCYETQEVGEATITVEGRLLDHAVTGIMMIHDEEKNGSYNPEKIMMLKHMIASHHGKKEWDAITTPAFPEAAMLNLIDLADSRMNMFEEAYKGQDAGTVSSEKVYGLENSYIYKPIYPIA